jgi:hypothetical protein
MLSELAKGILPRSWRRYTIPAGATAFQWVTDFSLRVKQLQQVSQAVSEGRARDLQTVTVWLGGLFHPEAYVTATRQCIAQVIIVHNLISTIFGLDIYHILLFTLHRPIAGLWKSFP